MKRFGKRTISFILCVLMLACVIATLAACDPTNTDSGDPKDSVDPVEYTVTFDQNYTGAPAATTQTVQDGGKVSKPSSDPTRNGYDFAGWYKDTAATVAYDFGSSVTSSLTLYAGWNAARVTVTFDLNYPDAAALPQTELNKGGIVSAPAAPTRDGFVFAGWFSDADGLQPYDFASAVQSDTTLYAKWLDASVTYFSVTFDMNYSGASAPITEHIAEGTTVSEPQIANRKEKLTSDDGKHSYDFCEATFRGWYTDAACTTAYDFSSTVTANITLYAKWRTRYNFEAELTDLTDKQGYGYSLGVNDEELIKTDTAFRNQGASFGYSVGYLYDTGLSVDYRIYSETAVENVTFVARLSSEYRDIYIAPSTTKVGDVTYQSFTFKVNDVALDYEPIALTGAKGQITANQRPFDNWTISTTVSLKAGWNDINLVVTNSDALESTIYAAAPMIDCIYLTSESDLSWQPKWSNMGKIKQVED